MMDDATRYVLSTAVPSGLVLAVLALVGALPPAAALTVLAIVAVVLAVLRGPLMRTMSDGGGEAA